MKTLLLNPPFRRRTGNIWRYVSGVLPPLGLGHIASYMESRGIDIDLLDAPAEGVDMNLLPRRLGDNRYDLIGITATTTMFPSAMSAAGMLRELYPRAVIAVGGPHATARPQEALESPAVDMVVSGEGEHTFAEIALGSDPDKTPGVVVRDGSGGTKSAGPRPLVKNLDDLPFPAYHKMPMRRYRPAVGGYFRLPAVHTLTSRGCSHNCTYCYHVFGRGVRFRSIPNVLEELEYMVDRYGIREVYFYDDTFNVRRDRVVELCEGIMSRVPGIEWQCLARVNGMDMELLTLMKRSGCHSITYGIESADPAVLKNIHKNISIEEAARVIRQTVEADIICRAGFMLGNPGETMESIERTARFAYECGATGSMFNIVAPYPGTEMFETGVREGRITNFNWEEYDFSTPILEIPGLPAEEIRKAQRRINRGLFIRPTFFKTIIPKTRTLNYFQQLLIGGLSVSGMLELYDRFDDFLKGRIE